MHKTWDNGLGPALEYTSHPRMGRMQQHQKLLELRSHVAAIPGITNAKPSLPDGFFAEIREIPAAYLAQFQHVEIVVRVLILEDETLILELAPPRLNDPTMSRKALEALLATLPLI